MSITKCVVQLSGGIGSWASATRIIAKYGKDNVTLLFADTKIEDEDLYRFLDDIERTTGIAITRIANGLTVWEVFFQRRFIGNTRVDPCSLVLKRELLKAWVSEHCDPATTSIAIGIDWTETHRCERITEGNKPFTVEYPLIEDGVDKVQCFDELKASSIEAPRLYAMGFPHNNCGGFCVKAGVSQFVALRRHLPDRFEHHADKEQEMRDLLGRDVAILRDRRGGETKPMTLHQLAARMDAGERFPGDEWGACGCALDDTGSQLTLDLWGTPA